MIIFCGRRCPRAQNRKVGKRVKNIFFLTFFTRFQPCDLYFVLCFSAKVTVRLVFVAGAVLCDFQVVFAWQGHDFRIVRLDFAGRRSTL